MEYRMKTKAKNKEELLQRNIICRNFALYCTILELIV